MAVTMKQPVDWALSVTYQVSLDSEELGVFSTCEGLGVEVVLEVREEGGNNDFAWSLPTRLKYPNIKLTRPLSADAAKVLRWISQVVESSKRSNGTIVAKNSKGTPILKWALADVVPVRWTGPSLNPESSKVAIETLELAHHGFQVT